VTGGGRLEQGARSLDGADDGRGLHGLDAVDGAEAVRDMHAEGVDVHDLAAAGKGAEQQGVSLAT
jgi:hypothetical protein